MKRATAILSLLAAVPLAATVAVAGPGECGGKGHGGWHGRGERFERRLEELGLEPQQKEKVKAILDASKEDREEAHTKMREAHRELHSLLKQDSPDQAAIDRQVEKIGAMKVEAHKTMLHTLLAVRAELTPEQREKLKAMKKEHGKGKWKRGHHEDRDTDTDSTN